MHVQYYNLYTHFILTTLNRLPLINETHRNRIEKYITGIVNNLDSRMYAIQEEYKELMDYYQKTLKPSRVEKIR